MPAASIYPASCANLGATAQLASAKEDAAGEPQAEVKPRVQCKALAAQVGVAVMGDEKVLAAKPGNKPLRTKPVVKISARVRSDTPSSESQREPAKVRQVDMPPTVELQASHCPWGRWCTTGLAA